MPLLPAYAPRPAPALPWLSVVTTRTHCAAAGCGGRERRGARWGIRCRVRWATPRARVFGDHAPADGAAAASEQQCASLMCARPGAPRARRHRGVPARGFTQPTLAAAESDRLRAGGGAAARRARGACSRRGPCFIDLLARRLMMQGKKRPNYLARRRSAGYSVCEVSALKHGRVCAVHCPRGMGASRMKLRKRVAFYAPMPVWHAAAREPRAPRAGGHC